MTLQFVIVKLTDRLDPGHDILPERLNIAGTWKPSGDSDYRDTFKCVFFTHGLISPRPHLLSADVGIALLASSFA